MNIKKFISERFQQSVEQIAGKNDDIEFILFFELGVGKQSLSTKEDIANWWSLPYSVNRRLSFKEVVENIYFFDSLTPLVIKISDINKELIGLELSQKLRTRKEILNHHNDNKLAPFVIEPSYLKFDKSDERKGLLNYLTLTLFDNESLIKYFENNNPKVDEIITCIKTNFDNNYVHFPPNYNHREKDEKGYSELIIRKNLDDNSYILSNRENKVFEKSNDIYVLSKLYIKKELNNRIGKIELIE